MENITLPLRNGSCTIESDKITVTAVFGWKVVVDQFKQEITQQLSIFRLPIPLWKFRYKFSDVYRVGRVRTDKRAIWTDDSLGFSYDLILFFKSGYSLKVATVSKSYPAPIGGFPVIINIGMIIGQELQGLGDKPIETIHCIEATFRKMIGLPED